MNKFEEKLEMKVKDCFNTNSIFNTKKYVLLSDAKKILNQALEESKSHNDIHKCNCSSAQDKLDCGFECYSS